MKDANRLHQLNCKRLSSPACGGGELKGAEDEEEAFLTARVAAFWHSPEGRDRKRMRELEFKGIRRCLTLEEQKELDQLTLLYPEPPRETELQKAMTEWQKSGANKQPIIRDISIHQQNDLPMSLATAYLDGLNSEQRFGQSQRGGALGCAAGAGDEIIGANFLRPQPDLDRRRHAAPGMRVRGDQHGRRAELAGELSPRTNCGFVQSDTAHQSCRSRSAALP